MQQDLDELQDWSANWLLNFHPDKCQLLTLGTRKLESEYHLTSKNVRHELECVDSRKDLGVVIDYCLNFEDHIEDK